MNLIFLGTGAGKPTLARNVTSMFLNLQKEIHESWLFDCGEGTIHQMMRYNETAPKKERIQPNNLTKIFITHLHGDHILGLFGLITSRSMSQCETPLSIYGPKGIKELLDTLIRLTDSYTNFELNIYEIDNDATKHHLSELITTDKYHVSAIQLDHRTTSFGYQLTINDYQLVICGDTKPCDNLNILSKNADTLVLEATLTHDLQAMANSRGHSTTVESASLAHAQNVKQLIVTHLSARYNKALEDDFLKECTDIFPNTILAHDLLNIELLKK